MGKRLFVGGLPFAMGDQDLSALFASAGTVVSANVIMDKFSGRSKGFGFVEMSTDEEAQNAIQTLNNTEVQGRNIVVNEARPMEDRPRRDFGGGGRDSGGRNDRGGNDRRGGGRSGGGNRW